MWDRHVANFQIRAVDGKLTVRFPVAHRHFARHLQRAGDPVQGIDRPIIAQLDRAHRDGKIGRLLQDVRDIVGQKILARERDAVLFSQRHHALDFHRRAFTGQIGLDGIEKIFAGLHVRHVEMDLGTQITVVDFRHAHWRHSFRRVHGPGDFRRSAICKCNRAAGKIHVGAKDRVPDLSAPGDRRSPVERLRKFRRDRLQIRKRSGELDRSRATAEFADVCRKSGISLQAKFVQPRGRFSRIEGRNAVVRFHMKNGPVKE